MGGSRGHMWILVQRVVCRVQFSYGSGCHGGRRTVDPRARKLIRRLAERTGDSVICGFDSIWVMSESSGREGG